MQVKSETEEASRMKRPSSIHERLVGTNQHPCSRTVSALPEIETRRLCQGMGRVKKNPAAGENMQKSRMAKPAGNAAARRKIDLPPVAPVPLAAAPLRASSRAPTSAPMPTPVQHVCRPTSTPMLNRFYLFYISFFSSPLFYLYVGYPSRHPFELDRSPAVRPGFLTSDSGSR